ncbi:hypothetical protein QQ008_23235 [Fulvivirgaceae bacterium BMA10]|uniref:Uncharacterized protein n=1 Tax=Splendidivirga corallicola TaxID=3051826 RepID=A0ABT8KU82_9BACT|nr:hypothetical protein [Fulvivirgaceae bacterium BMA10]
MTQLDSLKTGDLFHSTVEQLTYTIAHGIFSSPMANRIYAYPNMEYMSLTAGNNDPGPQSAKVYNNTHYVTSNLNVELFKDRTAANMNFYNNIFYFEGSGSWGSEAPINCTFENNAYFNISAREDQLHY